MTEIKRYFLGQLFAFAYFAVCVIVGGYIFPKMLVNLRPDATSLFYGQIVAVILSFILAGYISTKYISSVKPKLGQLAAATAAVFCALAWVSLYWEEASNELYVLVILVGICFSFVGNQICTRKN